LPGLAVRCLALPSLALSMKAMKHKEL
jgi:hypothetical protein